MSRILLVYHNPLFALSIHAVLSAAPRLHLVGEVEDWACAGAEIARLAPDIVLVEEDEAGATEEILGILRAGSSPWRVVAMRMDDTMMHIWSGVGKELHRTQDLYSVLNIVPIQEKRPRIARRTAPAPGGR